MDDLIKSSLTTATKMTFEKNTIFFSRRKYIDLLLWVKNEKQKA